MGRVVRLTLLMRISHMHLHTGDEDIVARHGRLTPAWAALDMLQAIGAWGGLSGRVAEHVGEHLFLRRTQGGLALETKKVFRPTIRHIS